MGHCPQIQIYSQKSIGYPHEKFQGNCMSHSGENMFTYWHRYLHSDSSEITGPLITWRQESNNCSHSWHNSWSNIGPTHHFLTCHFFSSVAITFFYFQLHHCLHCCNLLFLDQKVISVSTLFISIQILLILGWNT